MNMSSEVEVVSAQLASLGYHYNNELQLRSVDGEKEFKFQGQASFALRSRCKIVYAEQRSHTCFSQEHYETLAVAVHKFVQATIVEKYGFERLSMKRTGVDVYRSRGADARDAMLVIICGTGYVMVRGFAGNS